MHGVSNLHRFTFLLEANEETIFRMSLRDGRDFRLRGFSQIDSSIYNLPDGWCAEIVEFVSPRDDSDSRLYPDGSSIDFYESDLREIVNEETGESVFVAANFGANPGDAV